MPLLGFADTGPEYLEFKEDQDPLSAAFLQYKLPFVEERHNILHLRSYYLDRAVDGERDREDWAGGGWFTVVSDLWEDRIKLGATAFTSQKIYADPDKGDTGLLQPGHNSYSGLGEIYASLVLDSFVLQAGRYSLSLPYINEADTRMIPQTFEGFSGIVKVNNDWSIVSGMLTQIKSRTSSGFDPLYDRAGLDGDENISGAGTIYQPEEGTLAGLYYFNAPDFMNNTYVELSKRYSFDDSGYIQVGAQYTRQEAIGKELGGNFDVDHYGAKLSWKIPEVSFSAAWTYYSNTELLRRPWGSIPGYTSVMVKDFARPGEKAWLVGSTLYFDRWGLPGLDINAKHIRGDTPDCGKNASPDQNETDVTVQYKSVAPVLKGFSLRVRNAWIRQSSSCGEIQPRDFVDFRIILNYELVL